jgi:hypothetical protein
MSGSEVEFGMAVAVSECRPLLGVRAAAFLKFGPPR